MDAQPVRFLGRLDAGRTTGHDKELEDDDPYEVVGVRYPVVDSLEADRELARCFVEEYALIGWSPARIRGLFTSQEYAGAHGLATRRGMALIDEALGETFGAASEPEVR